MRPITTETMAIIDHKRMGDSDRQAGVAKTEFVDNRKRVAQLNP